MERSYYQKKQDSGKMKSENGAESYNTPGSRIRELCRVNMAPCCLGWKPLEGYYIALKSLLFEKESEKTLPFIGSFLKWSQQLRKGQVEARSPKFHPDFATGYWEFKYLGHNPLPAKSIISLINGKWNN